MSIVVKPGSATEPTGTGVEPTTDERLELYRAKLQRLGITDLGPLGKLDVAGPVVPTSGLTVPRPDLYGGAVTVQGVVRAAETSPSGAVTLQPLQEPAVEVRAAPAGEVGVNEAIWVADEIVLAAGTTVVLRWPHKYLRIIARRLTVGPNVVVTWERPVPAAVPVKPAKPPRQGGSDDGSGDPGNPGAPGGSPVDSPEGQGAPEIELWVLEMTGNPVVLLDGQPGFNGADGGDGGDGQRGHNGDAEKVDWVGPLHFCKAGPGYGGRGGDAGPGGKGAKGGKGGHGGAFDLYAPFDVVLGYAKSHYVSIAGGPGGTAGRGGEPGRPGEGGSRGWCHYCCPTENRDGQLGGYSTRGGDGAPGPAGETYDGLDGRRHGVGFHVIDAEAFERVLTAPAIVRTLPAQAHLGDVGAIEGVRLLPDDEVLVDGNAVPTRFVSETRLEFDVPAASGGRHEVVVRQSDGTTSNKDSLYIWPSLSATQPAGRVRPGTVTLTGGGFAPGARVIVNGQQMGGVEYVEPGRLTFTLVRPSNVVANPDGEQLTLRVQLPTGEDSNELQVLLETYVMLVLGDSVAWGQGLTEAEKHHSIVEARIAATQGGVHVYKRVLAHSGATIGLGDDSQGAPIDGEVPTSYPTILRQVDLYEERFHGKGENVDLVVITGGINDLGIGALLSPASSPEAMAEAIDAHCYSAMRVLLEKTTATFANAQVVVTGYYPIINADSNLGLLDAAVVAMGLTSLPGLMLALGLGIADVKARIVVNCRFFAERSGQRSRAAVDDVNDRLPGGPRVHFAQPRFGDRNAALGTEPWVFGLNNDGSLQDPAVAPGRAEACRINPGRTGPHCPLASVGHPNALGAQEYARAVVASLDGTDDPLAALPAAPEGFLWGTADSSYQVEGGIENNDWSRFTTSENIRWRVRTITSAGGLPAELKPAEDAIRHADLATLEADLDRAAMLGLKAHRFSFEWARLQPHRPAGSGPLTDADFDPAALAYYDAVVAAIRERGMEPVVSLNHLNLPLWVCTPPEQSIKVEKGGGPFPISIYYATEDEPFKASLRGWETKATVDAFVAFSRFMVTRLRDRVKYWLTLNEPVGSMVGLGYIAGVWPPGFIDGDRARTVLFNLVRAHVRAYDAIKEIDPGAQVSFAHNVMHAQVTNAPVRMPWGIPEAARNQFDYFYNWFWLEATVKGRIDRALARRAQDRDLVKPGEMQAFFGEPIADTAPWKPRADFIGINYYRTVHAYFSYLVAAVAGFSGGVFNNDQSSHPEEPHGLLSELGWELRPEGLYDLLVRLRDGYGLPVMITENGTAEHRDRNRPAQITSHIAQMLRAMRDGVDVRGYLHWTLVDNWELHENYRPEARFGLFTVDRSDPAQPRRITDSALAYRSIATTGRVEDAIERYGTITPEGDRVRPPHRSPDRTFEGKLDDGTGFTLLVARRADGELTGSLQQWSTGTGAALRDVTWEADGARLRFAHDRVGPLPARTFEATVDGGRLAGTCKAGNATQSWEARTVAAAGVWLSDKEPRCVSIDRLAGGAGRWSARVLSSGASASWWSLDHVDCYEPALSFSNGFWQFQGAVGGDRISGIMHAGAGAQGGRTEAWEATRAPDDLPFGPGAPTPLPPYACGLISVAAYADSAKRIAVELTRLAAGQQAWIVVRAANLGTSTWTNSGSGRVLLGTDGPRDRKSALATAAWISPSRAAALKEASVETGATGTFEFAIKAPATATALTERFNLLAEGVRWMNDTGLAVEVRTRAQLPALAYAVVEQRAYADANREQEIDLRRLAAGDTAWLVVRARNEGAATWRPGGATPIRLGTSDPHDRASSVATDAWISPTRAAAATEPSVPPGAVATFEFPVEAKAPGALDERFAVVADGAGWAEGPDVTFHCEVSAPVGELPALACQFAVPAAFRDAASTKPLDLVALAQGDSGWIVVRAANTGTATWSNAGDGAVQLAVSPAGRTSVLISAPAPLSESSVAPGATGTFMFAFVAPAAGTKADEAFQLVTAAGDRFPGQALTLRVEVTATTPAEWGSLGGDCAADPAVMAQPDQRIAVFARAANGTLAQRLQQTPGGGWGAWSALGAPAATTKLTGAPVPARNADGRLAVYARGRDSALWQRWQSAPSGPWAPGWTSRAGFLAGDPAAGLYADGRVAVFAVTADGGVAYRAQTAPSGSPGPWAPLGPPSQAVKATGTPAVVSRADGRLVVIALGTDGALWIVTQAASGGTWGAWASLGRPAGTVKLAGAPVAARNKDGRVGVFARGTDRALWHRWQTAPNGGWSAGWTSRGGALAGDPAIAVHADGRMAAFARSGDGALAHATQSAPGASWLAWASLGRPGGGAALAGRPAMATFADLRLALIVRDADGALWQRVQKGPNGPWT